MKKVIVLLSVLIFSVSTLKAQNYQQAFGIKLGYTQSFEYKTFTSANNFINAGIQLHTLGHFGVNGYAFYNFNNPINGNDLVNWYYGPGATIGYGGHLGGFNLSVNCQIGIEVLFANAPIAISLDWAPGLGLGFYENVAKINFSPTYGGLTLKYVL